MVDLEMKQDEGRFSKYRSCKQFLLEKFNFFCVSDLEIYSIIFILFIYLFF